MKVNFVLSVHDVIPYLVCYVQSLNCEFQTDMMGFKGVDTWKGAHVTYRHITTMRPSRTYRKQRLCMRQASTITSDGLVLYGTSVVVR